ncbi:MAG: type II toxin-antitoxin system VapC family toxin [Saprospiraceae bacterium]|nr:type II toxin-antitoxin system VapC family toxin [Saprospiraceae bacterium]MDZ4705145.1 type II toxin-antitoxin system VapC family toxin [Saprospiraceae bacterium]
MKKVVLDTNAYTALIQGQSVVKQAIENAEQVLIPVFVMAELLFGFKNGNRERENSALFQDFLKLPGVSIQHTTNETAQIYSTLLLDLKQKGTPIPTHDIWIAAIAIETGSVIITYDKHFLNIVKARVWRAYSSI